MNDFYTFENGEGALVETVLWALDLLAVAYLCFWARQQDMKQRQSEKESKASR